MRENLTQTIGHYQRDGGRWRDERERRNPKFEVQGSKFRKPRTSDLEPSPVSPVPPFPLVALNRDRH